MRLRLAVISMALLFAGCGGALSEGKAQFNKGRYPEARQTFLSIEDESRSWDDARRAQYALYRGLTHLALGDKAQAGVWLREAKAMVDARPGALSIEDAERLRVGLAQLDQMP